MWQQFFGRTTWWTAVGLALGTTLGALVFRVEVLQPIILIFLAGLSGYLYVKRPSLAFVLVFAELFGFSHGRLFGSELFGVLVTGRMAIFIGVLLAWVAMVLFANKSARIPYTFLYGLILLFVALSIGVFIGVGNNTLSHVFDDLNGYLYLLYALPILTVPWTRDDHRTILQALFGSALWMGILSLVLLYLFSHLGGEASSALYTLLRDARIGEFTFMDAGYWRIFLQSQIVLVVTLVMSRTAMIEDSTRWFDGRSFLWLTLLFSGFIVSFSRSFWLGLVCGAIAVVVMTIRSKKLRPALRNVPTIALAFVASLVLLAAVSILPWPLASNAGFGGVRSRATDLSDVAVSSRWNLLPVMSEAILEAPILGHGFGKQLTFVTDDPRARAIAPDGTWTTYKFEWGWLDLWVKMGFLGVASFLWMFWALAHGVAKRQGLPWWLRTSMIAVLVAVFFIHGFSPYLNHPLGLGVLLFAVFFLGDEPQPRLVMALAKRVQMSRPYPSEAVSARISKTTHPL
ncbi:MAG: hypothetical protein UY95_C0004G0016 [Parcubacteria group bacterium GW2011_GWA2_56_7]|nr:MAG: hypothetical protein UY95_C0004G0016 [Parcubacteria group bacterium GW2011_GWA2_56_7]